MRPLAMLKRWIQATNQSIKQDGALQPFRLLKQDWCNLPRRWLSDWTASNHLVVASAVYVFFTNLLPGITFASDLYGLTGKNWGTIEIQPLTILGVTGPFSILAENIYSLCEASFKVGGYCCSCGQHLTRDADSISAIHGMVVDHTGRSMSTPLCKSPSLVKSSF
jgi:hypothetical protein